VAAQGFKIVLLTRLSPVLPFVMLNYAFGLTRVRLRDYVLASWIGMFPGTLMYVYLGSAVKNIADLARGDFEGGPWQNVLFFAGLIATVVVTVLVTRIAKQALDRAVHDSSVVDSGVVERPGHAPLPFDGHASPSNDADHVAHRNDRLAIRDEVP